MIFHTGVGARARLNQFVKNWHVKLVNGKEFRPVTTLNAKKIELHKREIIKSTPPLLPPASTRERGIIIE